MSLFSGVPERYIKWCNLYNINNNYRTGSESARNRDPEKYEGTVFYRTFVLLISFCNSGPDCNPILDILSIPIYSYLSISIYIYLYPSKSIYLSIYLCLYLYLYLCLYLYLSISIYIYLYLSISIYIYLYLSKSIYIYLYLSISIYIYLYLSISIYIYLYLSISIYIYLYLSISIYIYLYLSISISISNLSIYLSIYLCVYSFGRDTYLTHRLASLYPKLIVKPRGSRAHHVPFLAKLFHYAELYSIEFWSKNKTAGYTQKIPKGLKH